MELRLLLMEVIGKSLMIEKVTLKFGKYEKDIL